MASKLYLAGNAAALVSLGFQKHAFWRPLLTGAKALGTHFLEGGQGLGAAAKAIGSKLGPSAIGERLAPYGANIEGAAAKGVGNFLGPHGEQLANRMLSGTTGEIARQTVGGAAIGGLFEGGLGAALADDGHRGEAFTHGLSSGALSGAAFGSLSGAAGKMINNTRRLSLEQMAKRQNLAGPAAQKAVEGQLNRGFFGSLRDVIKPSEQATLGRAGALQNAVGGLSEHVGAGIALPMALLPGGESEPAQPPQTNTAPSSQLGAGIKTSSAERSSEPIIPPQVLLASGTGALGGITTGTLADAILPKGPAPFGKYISKQVASRALTALGSAGGYLGGHYLGKKIYPPKPPPVDPVDEKLDQIDFDKLMRYYKKRPGAPE